MNNWSIDEEKLRKDPHAHAIWKLSQMANFGVGNEKIKMTEYRKYANEINIEDPWRKKYLDLLVYGEDSN